MKLVAALEGDDDVQNVYTNLGQAVSSGFGRGSTCGSMCTRASGLRDQCTAVSTSSGRSWPQMP